MTPKQEFRNTMIDLYSSALTAADIVRRYRRSYTDKFKRIFSERRLQEIWADAKDAGKLPADRPHFLKNCVSEIVLDGGAIDAAADRDLMRQMDQSERRWESAGDRNERACAESLAALRAAHPEMDNAAEQTAPELWLKRDLDAGLAPGHEQLMGMARKLDAGCYR